jgi:hypothetical protein
MTITDGKRDKTSVKMEVSPALTPEEQSQQAVITPQELYKQGMQDIWEKIHQLPEGQNQVVMSQIWMFAKSSANPDPKDFPALAIYGFIAEQLVEDQVIWKPYSPYLKDFRRIGIELTWTHGFQLRSSQAFQASLSAAIHWIFN